MRGAGPVLGAAETHCVLQTVGVWGGSVDDSWVSFACSDGRMDGWFDGWVVHTVLTQSTAALQVATAREE